MEPVVVLLGAAELHFERLAEPVCFLHVSEDVLPALTPDPVWAVMTLVPTGDDLCPFQLARAPERDPVEVAEKVVDVTLPVLIAQPLGLHVGQTTHVVMQRGVCRWQHFVDEDLSHATAVAFETK